MEQFEKDQIKQWHDEQEFEKIVQYIDLLKEPTYEHLGHKASALNNLRQYYEALAVLESIRENGEDDALWHYRYAYTLMSLEKYEKAEEHLLKCVALNTDVSDVWFLLSILYEYYIDNPEKKAWVEQHVNDEKFVMPEELYYDDFVAHQTFNKDYELLKHLYIHPQIKSELIAHYEQFIYALEHVVYTNDQLIPLMLGLAKTIKQSFDQMGIYLSDELASHFVGEMIYILQWFGLDEDTGEKLVYLFSYTLIYNPNDAMVKPDHLVHLVHFASQNEHQKIIDFFFSIDPTERHYGYYEWLIQSAIHLNDFQLAKKSLEHVSKEGTTHDMWHYWHAIVAANEARFIEAEWHLKQALAIESKNINAWQLLERVYLEGLDDIKQANIVREKLEQILDELENE